MPVSKPVATSQLALKAGKLVRGDALIPSIQKGQAKLVVVSELCGANRRKKIHDKCAFYKVDCIDVDPEQFDAVSPRVSGAYAIVDEGFARSILDGFNQIKGR